MYAVFGFYVLSGYLMTLSLNRVYGFSAGGVGRFFANRWLCIFVPYYAVLLMSFVFIALLPEDASSLN